MQNKAKLAWCHRLMGIPYQMQLPGASDSQLFQSWLLGLVLLLRVILIYI